MKSMIDFKVLCKNRENMLAVGGDSGQTPDIANILPVPIIRDIVISMHKFLDIFGASSDPPF